MALVLEPPAANVLSGARPPLRREDQLARHREHAPVLLHLGRRVQPLNSPRSKQVAGLRRSVARALNSKRTHSSRSPAGCVVDAIRVADPLTAQLRQRACPMKQQQLSACRQSGCKSKKQSIGTRDCETGSPNVHAGGLRARGRLARAACRFLARPRHGGGRTSSRVRGQCRRRRRRRRWRCQRRFQGAWQRN